jgi:hypothetical protein
VIDGTEMLRPATAPAKASDATIVWSAETSEPTSKTEIAVPRIESRPENSVGANNASQYDVASRPVETPVQYEPASRPIETPVQSVKEPKPRKTVEEAKLPQRPSENSRESAREQPRVTARRDGWSPASVAERDWRVATAFPRHPFPMLFVGVGW